MRKGIPALLLTLSLLLCGCRLLPERIPPAGLTVHFIDVGQADCALLESGGAGGEVRVLVAEELVADLTGQQHPDVRIPVDGLAAQVHAHAGPDGGDVPGA